MADTIVTKEQRTCLAAANDALSRRLRVCLLSLSILFQGPRGSRG